MKPKRLLLAGSHAATPAYAVTQEIKRRKLPWEIYFVGRRWAFEGKRMETLEFRELPKLGVKFYPLESGKVQTKFTRYTIPALLKTPFGLIQSLVLILKIKPDLTLTFGGASGALTSFWSWVLGIPVLVHEQTAAAGRANIFSARFARKVMLSRRGSKQFFANKSAVVTGNPLTFEIARASKEKPREVIKTILVTGGSRGSTRINDAVSKILPRLEKQFEIIHLTGKVEGRLGISQMAKALKRADMVIARAGANTVAEIIALKKPAIFVPIPWSYKDEQTKNAEFAARFGLIRILPQKFLSGKRLEMEIEKLKSDLAGRPRGLESGISPDLDASKKVVKILEKYI